MIVFWLVCKKQKQQVAVISIHVHNCSVVHINCQCYYSSRQRQCQKEGAKVGRLKGHKPKGGDQQLDKQPGKQPNPEPQPEPRRSSHQHTPRGRV